MHDNKDMTWRRQISDLQSYDDVMGVGLLMALFPKL